MKAGPPGYPWSKYELGNKTLSQCDGNADADNRGDCNSSPCTSYRQANYIQHLIFTVFVPFPFINLCGFGSGILKYQSYQVNGKMKSTITNDNQFMKIKSPCEPCHEKTCLWGLRPGMTNWPAQQ